MEIITLGNDILTRKSVLVDEIDKGIEDLIAGMTAAMDSHQGIGLAAPQLGALKRIFICHAPGDLTRVFINPEIIQTSVEQVPYEEGCLSIPGIYADVVRPREITIQALNIKGKPFSLDADGILARIIQHELDHLRGVLFIDYVAEKKRERLIKSYSLGKRA